MSGDGEFYPEDEPSLNGSSPWRPVGTGDGIRRPDVRPTVLGNLLYPGKLHTVSGPPEAGKTLLALWLALAAIRRGGPVVMVDHEAGYEQTVGMLRALGADPQETDKLLTYIPFPEVAYRDADLANLADLMAEARPVLTIGTRSPK